MQFLEYLDWLGREYYFGSTYVYGDLVHGEIRAFSNQRIIENLEGIPYSPQSLAEDILFGFPCVGRALSAAEYEEQLHAMEFDLRFSQVAVIRYCDDIYYEFCADALHRAQEALFCGMLEVLAELCKEKGTDLIDWSE